MTASGLLAEIADVGRDPKRGGYSRHAFDASDTALHERVMEEIMRPTVRAMAAEGRPYRGVLYAGLMLVDRRRMPVRQFGELGLPCFR